MDPRSISILVLLLQFLCLAVSVSGQTNNAPTAGADSITVHGSCDHPLSSCPNALLNDSDPDVGQTLHVGGQTMIPVGSLGFFSINTGGGIGFYVNNGVTSGSGIVQYNVCDTGVPQECVYGTVNISVFNSAPHARTDFYEVTGGYFESITGDGIYANDSDSNGDSFVTGSFTNYDSPYGALTVYESGKISFGRTIPYTFSGVITYGYQICDTLGACSWGTIVILLHGSDNAGNFCPIVGKPVNVTTGNMWLQQTDYSLPGFGEPIEINRFYNSVKQSNGLFGLGWTTKYDESLVAYGDKMLQLNLPDGHVIYLARALTSDPFVTMNADLHGQVVQNTDSTYTLTFKDGRTHKFTSTGVLLWQEDRNGNRTTLTYDTSGLLTSITDAGGRTLTFTYSSGNISEISDSLGSVASYEYYTGTTRLKTVTYNDGSKFKFDYDTTTAAGKVLLTTVKDAQDNILETHEYDSTGRALTSEIEGGKEKYTFNYSNWTATVPYTKVTYRKQPTDPDIETKYYFDSSQSRNVITKTEGVCSCGGVGSEVTEYHYDGRLNVTKKIDALSNETLFSYDANGNLATRTDKYGTERFTYNSLGELLTYKDRVDSQASNVNTAVMTYNTAGNLLTYTDALGKVTTLEYPTTNNKGLPKSVTDARNNKTGLKWFASGQLDEIEDPYAKKTKFTYDARGRTKTVTNALNHVTTYNYFDDTNRKVEVVYPNADKITYKYDIRRTLESFTDERGKVTGYEFDPQYRLKKVTDPLGHYKEFGYDDMSNMTSFTDALGNVTNYEYDDFDRVKKIVHPAATTGGTRLDEEFEYDKLGRLTKYSDTANRDTVYAYNDATRTNTVTNAESEVTTVKYNQRFQTTEVKDALNQTYTFSYDPLGRLLSQTRAGGTMSFEYDNVGNRKKRTDYAGRVTNYTYDNLNRLTKIEYDLGAGNDTDKPQSTYFYDDISRLTSAINNAGTVAFTYDNRSRLKTETDVFGQVLEYGYDAASNRTQLKLDGSVHTSYAYDDANRLTTLTDEASQSFTYGYDNADRLTSRAFPNGVTSTFEYDGMSRLKRLKHTSSTATLFDNQYSYNTASQISGITDLMNTRVFGYDLVDRLTSVHTNGTQTESYTFDDVGNRTATHLSASYGYQSSKFNQLASTVTANYQFDANGNTIQKSEGKDFWRYTWDYENRLVEAATRKEKARYKYDALGRRVERNLRHSKERTRFTHDGLDVVMDDDADTGITKYQNGLGIDDKLKLTNAGTPSYFLGDHLGSTLGLANSSASVTSSNSYDAFGNPAGSLASRYQFTGREFDNFSGLQFSRARFYDSKLGRFISEDPIGFGGGDVNLYGYVWNRPQNLVDPAGTDGCRRLPNGKCAPPPAEPSGPPEPPRRPPFFITDPPKPTPTPFAPSTPTPPPAQPYAPPTGQTQSCECKTAIPRMPDFYSLGAYFPVGGIVGVGATFSFDLRNGGAYVSPGLNFGLPTGTGVSGMGGWLVQRCEPTDAQIDAFLTGPGGTYSVFVPPGVGAGTGYSSGGTAFLLGAGSPGSSYSYGSGYRYW